MAPLNPSCTPMSSRQCKGIARKLNLRPILSAAAILAVSFDVFGWIDQLLALSLRFLLSKNRLLNRANEHAELA